MLSMVLRASLGRRMGGVGDMDTIVSNGREQQPQQAGTSQGIGADHGDLVALDAGLGLQVLPQPARSSEPRSETRHPEWVVVAGVQRRPRNLSARGLALGGNLPTRSSNQN
jgi:hypothetical protein